MKQIPTRSCCVCGKKSAPNEFLRVASQKGGSPQIAPSPNGAKMAGRGAYLCASLSCLEKAFQRKSFERALKLQNPLPNGLKDDLRKQILASNNTSPLAGTSNPQGNHD